MNPRLKNYLLYSAMGIVLFLLEETIRLKNTGFGTKTLWDWMELLVIPLVLAGGAFYLERSERAIERQRADERARLERQHTDERARNEQLNAAERALFERMHAEQRAKLEREIATDRQQEAALQSYLDRMTELLLKENLRTAENEEVRNVARIRTLTILRGLDGRRKGDVLLFLSEAELIDAPNPVIFLNGADLSGAHLQGLDLGGAHLQSVNFSSAILHFAILERASLVGSSLQDAKLDQANLEGANLQLAFLDGASLKKTIMPDGTIHE